MTQHTAQPNASAADTLLVLGFDGLDHQLFSKRLPDGFDLRPLFAPVPVTGPSWTSLYTGDSVATHGVRDVYGFDYRSRYSRNDTVQKIRWLMHNFERRLRGKSPHGLYATYATTPSRYLWDSLAPAGVDIKLVNLPITSPVRPVNGLHLGGFPLVTRRRWFYPESLAGRIPDDYVELVDIIHWFSDPEMDPHAKWRNEFIKVGLDASRDRIRNAALRLCELTADLRASRPADPAAPGELVMMQLSFVDRIGHVFNIAGQAETFCYELVCEVIARMGELIRPTSTLVISDHGFAGDNHTDYGCLAAAGRIAGRIAAPADYTPSVLDVAPTVARYFGVEHPCEGNDLIQWRSDAVARSGQQDEQDKQEIIRRLRDLGYM